MLHPERAPVFIGFSPSDEPVRPLLSGMAPPPHALGFCPASLDLPKMIEGDGT